MPLRPVHCWARSRVSPMSAGLGGGVRRLRQPAGGEPEDAADVDDAAAGLHHPAAGLRHPVAAVEVHVDDLAELLGRLAGGGHGGADAGVVDEHVDPAELRHRGVDERLAGLRVGDVGLHRQRAAARRPPRARLVSSSRSTRRAPSTTSAPASARAWANATPSPEEAPVTIATLPSRRNRSRTRHAVAAFRGRARRWTPSRRRCGASSSRGRGRRARRTRRSGPGRRAAGVDLRRRSRCR